MTLFIPTTVVKSSRINTSSRPLNNGTPSSSRKNAETNDESTSVAYPALYSWKVQRTNSRNVMIRGDGAARVYAPIAVCAGETERRKKEAIGIPRLTAAATTAWVIRTDRKANKSSRYKP